MTITFYFFDYELAFLIITILWIIQGFSLIFGSKLLKNDSNELRFLKNLIIAGYILTLWFIAHFFLPTRMALYSYTEFEENLFFTITLMIYSVIPNSVFIIIGVAIFLFFYKNNHLYQKPLVYTSILFTGGYILDLFNSVLIQFLIRFDVYVYLDLIDLFLGLKILSLCMILSAVVILILFSIYLNNRYFMIFSGLFLFQLFYMLFPILTHL